MAEEIADEDITPRTSVTAKGMHFNDESSQSCDLRYLEKETLSKLIDAQKERSFDIPTSNFSDDPTKRNEGEPPHSSGGKFNPFSSFRDLEEADGTYKSRLQRTDNGASLRSVSQILHKVSESAFVLGLGDEVQATPSWSRYDDDNSTIATTETAAKALGRESLLSSMYFQVRFSGTSLANEAEATVLSEEKMDMDDGSYFSIKSNIKRSSIRLLQGLVQEVEATLEDGGLEDGDDADDDDSLFGTFSLWSNFSAANTIDRYTFPLHQTSICGNLKLEAEATQIQMTQEASQRRMEREVMRLRQVVKSYPLRHFQGREDDIYHIVIPHVVQNKDLRREFRFKLLSVKPTSQEEVSSVLEKFLMDKAEDIDRYTEEHRLSPIDQRSTFRRSIHTTFTKGVSGLWRDVSNCFLSIDNDKSRKILNRFTHSVSSSFLREDSNDITPKTSVTNAILPQTVDVHNNTNRSTVDTGFSSVTEASNILSVTQNILSQFEQECLPDDPALDMPLDDIDDDVYEQYRSPRASQSHKEEHNDDHINTSWEDENEKYNELSSFFEEKLKNYRDDITNFERSDAFVQINRLKEEEVDTMESAVV